MYTCMRFLCVTQYISVLILQFLLEFQMPFEQVDVGQLKPTTQTRRKNFWPKFIVYKDGPTKVGKH